MSGKPKPGRPSPGSEAEQLRELTRAAHEAARDLRQALREARETTHQLQADHVAALDKSLQLATAVIAEHMQHAEEELSKAAANFQGEVFRVSDHVSRLLGASSLEGVVDEIINQAAADLSRALAADLVLPHGAELKIRDRDGYIQAGSQTPPANIFVVTNPRDAPPGSVVIDGR